MILPFFCLLTVFLSGSLAYGDNQNSTSPKIQKKIAEPFQKQPTLPKDASTTDEMKILDEVEKETAPSEELPETTEEKILEKTKKEIEDAPKKKTFEDLTPAEQAFANNLGPTHKKVFCFTFSANERSLAMNMVGKTDSKGNLVTPTHAVDIVAAESDIPIPFIEIEDLNESLLPQSQNESP